jgi:hypothetical protein
MIRQRAAKTIFLALLLAVVWVAQAFTSDAAMGQSTIATGSIQGTILDSSGPVIPSAKFTVRNKDTGQTFQIATSSSGAYTSGAIVPGNYSVRAEAQGFKTVEQAVVVRVGETAGANLTLPVGAGSTIVEVEAQRLP